MTETHTETLTATHIPKHLIQDSNLLLRLHTSEHREMKSRNQRWSCRCLQRSPVGV